MFYNSFLGFLTLSVVLLCVFPAFPESNQPVPVDNLFHWSNGDEAICGARFLNGERLRHRFRSETGNVPCQIVDNPWKYEIGGKLSGVFNWVVLCFGCCLTSLTQLRPPSTVPLIKFFDWPPSPDRTTARGHHCTTNLPFRKDKGVVAFTRPHFYISTLLNDE